MTRAHGWTPHRCYRAQGPVSHADIAAVRRKAIGWAWTVTDDERSCVALARDLCDALGVRTDTDAAVLCAPVLFTGELRGTRIKR